MSIASSLAKLGSGVGYIYLTDTSDDIQYQFINDADGVEKSKRFMLTSYVASSNVSAFSTVEVTSAGGNITNLSYDGVSVFDVSSAVTGATTADLAANLSSAINSYVSTPQYTATVSGSVVTVYLASSEGSSLNGTVAASSVTGTAALTATDLGGGTSASDEVDSLIGLKMYINPTVGASIDTIVGATDITSAVMLKSFNSPTTQRNVEIVSGGITVDRDAFITVVNVQTEGAIAADDLETINSGVFSSGDILILKGQDAAKVTTVTEGGNIELSNNADFLTGDKDSVIMLQYDNSVSPKWYEISRSPGNVISVPTFRSAGIPQPVSGVEVSAITLSGASTTITPGTDKGVWALTGTGTLTGSVSYSLAPGVVEGDTITIRFSGGITLGGFNLVIGGITLSQEKATNGVVVKNVWEGSSWIPTVLPYVNNRDVVDTVQLATKEDDLGNPATDGQVLSSTAAGVRSWIDQPNPFFTATTTTSVYSSAGSDEVLMTKQLSAGRLSSIGDFIDIAIHGTTAANANAKTLRLDFGGTAVAQNTDVTNPNGEDFIIRSTMMRISNTDLKVSTSISLGSSGVENDYTIVSSLNLDGVNYGIDFVANAVANSDVTMYFTNGTIINV
jgi:hypothetical protein